MDNSKGEKNMEDQAWRIIPEYLVRIFQYAFLHVDRISKLGFRSQRQDWLATWFFFLFYLQIQMWNRMLPMDKNDNYGMATCLPRSKTELKSWMQRNVIGTWLKEEIVIFLSG